MHGLERLLADDEESAKLLRLARAVPSGSRSDASASRGPLTSSADGDPVSKAQLREAALTGAELAVKVGRPAGRPVDADVGVGGFGQRSLGVETTRIAALEARVAGALQTLLKEAQHNLQASLAQEGAENDRSFSKASRSRIDAELSYLRLPASSYAGAAVGRGVLHLSDAELRDMVENGPFLADENGVFGPRGVGPTPIPGLVHGLLEACQHHHAIARGMDSLLSRPSNATVEARAYALANSLGQLLIEVERECQALALGLAGSGSGFSPGAGQVSEEAAWVTRLYAEANRNFASGDSVPLRMDTLSDQLQEENEVLRRVIQQLQDD
eukprot:TRINITY_DN70710_c0_g1_i1.p1 TRINITY_DN70710_c0_g1~~TRINITY_DN70710_c0_g1_i1.p1  ORF type:complete len:328 (-),score=47.46 TRINITY_DN70710_c0_g1_i1:24-1007(-)